VEFNMAKKNRTICAWDENDIQKDFDRLRVMVSKPKFVCANCGRAARKRNGCAALSL
jgi:hypothetical protein